jgi:hydrogenase maturation factor
MYLVVPARLVRVRGLDAEAALPDGRRVAVHCILVPDANVGDWVLVHAGFAITHVNPADVPPPSLQPARAWSPLDEIVAGVPDVLDSTDADAAPAPVQLLALLAAARADGASTFAAAATLAQPVHGTQNGASHG